MAGRREAIASTGRLEHLPVALIRSQLERILASRTFSNAPSLSRLLRHLVQEAIDDTASPSKEYSIGVEVFDRGEAFDPRIDTIVRVQARRLRAKLTQYYAVEGQADPVIIEVPKGQYVANFRLLSHQGLISNTNAVAEPGSETRSMQGVTQSQTGHLPLAPRRTQLIGREDQLALLQRLLLADRVPLVTLWGPGGVGKTRLAVEAAWEMANRFPGGVYFVSLAGVSDAGMVGATLAQTFGLREVAGKPLTVGLREHVRFTIVHRTLLVIDNVEHVLEASPMFGELLDACASLHILATSQAVLHVYGEQAIAVPPLPVPDLSCLPEFSEAARNPAIALFVQRAKAVDAAFELVASNCRAVAEICVRLDGLPLAIELAAARIRMLSPEAILARLGQPLELLIGGSRDAHARQQTLRNTVAWSYGLLDSLEQKLVRRLAVFSGGCTLESAEAVCDARRDLEMSIFHGISSLVDKSLLYQRERLDGESRFAMLQSIRDFAFERLIESGEEAASRRAHAAYVLVIAEERNVHATPSGISDWVKLCEAEHDNVRVALDWLIHTDQGEWALRLGLAMFHFWEAREHLAEGRERLQSILAMKSTSAATESRARVAFCAGTFAASQCDYDAALGLFEDALQMYREWNDLRGVAAMLTAIGTARRLSGSLDTGRSALEEALQAYRALHDASGIAGALSNLADVANAQGDYAAARALLGEAFEEFRQLGDSGGAAWSFSRLGDVAYLQEDWREAHRLYEEGLSIFRSIGDRWGMTRAYADLGHVACELGDYEQAQALFLQALETLRVLGHTRGMARVFEGMACLNARTRRYARALKLAGVAAGLRRRLGASTRPDEIALLHRQLNPAWENLDPASARSEWISGSEMPLEEAIRFALQPV